MKNENLIKKHLNQYTLGAVLSISPLLGGTVNSNYLIETTKGKWVFTILEAMPEALAEALSQFLVFLNHQDFPTPIVQSTRTGEVLSHFKKKPSLVVSYLEGTSPLYPTLKECHQVGGHLARLHLLTQKYIHPLTNSMNNDWRSQTAQKILNQLTQKEQQLVKNTLSLQQNLPYDKLPTGIVHFDLFRDNTLFIEEKLQGIIDFYYACSECLLMDISIAIHDWCTDWEDPHRTLLPDKVKALITGYELQRPLLAIEQEAMPSMLKISALHFGLARMQHLKKDPEDYKKIFLNLF